MGTSCNNCGWINNDNSIRCIKCGKPLTDNSLSKVEDNGTSENKKSFFTRLFNWFKRKVSTKEEAIVNKMPAEQESAKCPQCGNAIELLLPCMGFEDPVVYKCAHCQCTITHPGTSIITESGKLIPSWSKQENIINLNNRYNLIRQIGEGGYGIVWLAYDDLNDTEVAIKIYKDSIPCDIVERARKEYAIGMSLYHPNILPSYDFNHYEGALYIVVPYCSFGSIDKLCGTIPEQTLWRIIKDIASGLEYLHNCGIMHLDIKPANILLDSQGRYVISDFGLSHRVTSLIHSYYKAKTIGGAAYMSPERCCTDGKVDSYSDIWSLGVSIYELITGELPFHGWGGQQQLSDRILTLRCDKCSVKLSNLIDACISPYPQNRPLATEIIALADSVITGNENAALFDLSSNDAIFKKEGSFFNTYNETILNAMKRYKIAKSTDKSLYGIVDEKGSIIVDFQYDEIRNLKEVCWPGPGPLPPRENFFIGAFFRQGDDAGYLIMRDAGDIAEYKRCPNKEFIRLCQLS